MDLGPLLPELSPLAFVVRPLVIYLVVLTLLRLIGKHEIGALAPGDLVVLLLIAETLQGALVVDNTSILGGLLAAATLLLANWAVEALGARHPKIERVLSGEPIMLVYQGRFVEPNMRRENVSPLELESRLREHGIFDVAEVDLAILEPDGDLSVRRRPGAAEKETESPHGRKRGRRIG